MKTIEEKQDVLTKGERREVRRRNRRKMLVSGASVKLLARLLPKRRGVRVVEGTGPESQ